MSRLRRGIYWILIALAVGNMSGRILAVNSVDNIRQEADRYKTKLAEKEKALTAEGVTGQELEQQLAEHRIVLEEKEYLQRPFLSGNDRSRWATVRSLVELGTYEIDDIVSQRQWDTIDMVQHKNRAGEKKLYSSKPPLLATLMAGPYWVIHQATGATLGTHPYEIGRGLLLLVNVIPLVVMYLVLSGLLERYGTSDWGRIFIMAVATLGTFLTTFAVVLNNHLPGAVSVMIGLDATLRIWLEGDRRVRWFIVAGLANAFAATNELPACAFTVATTAVLLWTDWRKTLLAYLPCMLLVGLAYWGTNYVAHESLRPPYAHWNLKDKEDNWYAYTYKRNGKDIESYWLKPNGIDKGEASIKTYALHCLVGHHGVFSLTPVWLISFAGMLMWICQGKNRKLQALAAVILSMSVVVFVFYLTRREMQRNYGGMTSGLRWMFWFAPLWLFEMIPAIDRMARSRLGRGVAIVLLALSVMSASYPTWNPWIQPYLARYMEYMGWLKF
jgi:hypothetical protein